MARARISMQYAREILRHKWVCQRTHRETARALGVSLGVVGETASRAKKAGLTWEQVEQLDDAQLAVRLYEHRRGRIAEQPRKQLPDFARMHAELSRKGVTLQLLHVEYRSEHPDGYGYTQFCEHYRAWRKKQRRSMRQVHRAGEKMFVDYAGHKPHIIDPETGEVIEVELFVATLGASSYTYAEATRTQQLRDWTRAHANALDYFGGSAKVFVPDQLKAGVTTACKYEPGINRTYRELAEHYGAVVIPARPYKPKDKSKVEVAVQVAERWVLARLRNERFFSLEALNERIWELLEELNDRVMKGYGASRRDLFERLDRPALQPLPARRFEYGEWKLAKVNIDYHVELERHYYSVPHPLVGETVEVRHTATTVEVFFRNRRVAAHARSHRRGQHSTIAEHMPKSHRKQMEWTPTRLIDWASKIGPNTAELVTAILNDRPHPEMGYRSCLGILRLAKKYGAERLEVACGRAVAARARSYRHVDSILKNGLDQVRPKPKTEPTPTPSHENVRGPEYYH